MFRNAGLILATLGVLALALGCGDDDPKKKDTGPGVKLDGGGVTLDQGGGGNQDTGGGKQDTGGGTGTTCSGIASCVAACGSDTTCATKCVSKGTADGQKKFNALLSCISTQIAGSCKTQCADRSSTGCSTCIKTACATQYTACSGGGTPGTAGFGDKCSQSAPCKTGMICAMTVSGATAGFCTQSCTSKGGPCTGAPTGTEAYCILSDGKTPPTSYCAFLCKYKGSSGPKTVPCPSQLTCSTTESPAGSGQYSCVPK